MIARVVVTGGRHFTDVVRIESDQRRLQAVGLLSVAQGGHNVPRDHIPDDWQPTHSADALAFWCARSLGLWTPTYFADWETHGKGAGYRRNIEMIEAERPDLGLAYPNPESKGTWHCVREMLRRGIPVAVWTGALPDPTQTVVQVWHHRDGVKDTVCCSTHSGHTIFVPNGRPPNARQAQEWPPLLHLHKLVELFNSREAA